MSAEKKRRALSIPTRIFLAFALTLAAFASVAVTSVVQHDKTARNLRLLHDGYLPLAVRFNEARGHQTNLLQDLERIFDSSDWVRSRFDASRQTRLGARRRFVHHFEKAERAARAAEDAATMDGVRESYQAILDAYDASQSRYDRFFAALDADDDVVANEEHDGLMELEREILRHYREAYAQLVDRLDSIAAESASQERQASIVLGVLALVMLVVGLGATLWSQRILRPLPLLQERVAAVAAGDLSSRKLSVRGDDELARLAENFEGMVSALAARDARLRDLRRMQAQIVAGLRAAVVVVDAEGLVRTVNPAAQKVLALQPDHVGDPFDTHVLLDGLETALAAVRSSGDAVFLEAQTLGERRVDILATPFGRDEGEVLLVADDVTDALRTKDRLIHTERLAAIGRMAAHVTHEVRNPLSSIGLNVEMLEDELRDGDEEARTLMKAIQREVDRLTGITEEYLRLARLPQPRLEPDDLGELIQSVALFVRREMEASKVELQLHVDELPSVAFDEAQLRQALLNLLRNAREAMGEGVVQLNARARDGGVEIRVADRGPGIPAAERERIFDLFFTTKERGTGLGLPLTHQIVEAHSGCIECSANPEGGTVFTIWLPVTSLAAE